MINEDLYRRCLEAVAPKENMRLHKQNRIDYTGKAIPSDEWSRKQILEFLKSRVYATASDAMRHIDLDHSAIRSALSKMVREGIVMSGQDPSAKKTMYWLADHDDGFVPHLGRSKTTKKHSFTEARVSPRVQRIEEEREKTLQATRHDKWMHANTIASRTNIRVTVARGHLKRMSEMGMVDQKKIGTKTYWRRVARPSGQAEEGKC